MRAYVISTLGYALVSAMLISAAAAAEWHSPYVYRETSGTWTNVQYDDGVCHYYYSYNAYDQNTKIDRWGDCSHVAIGPGGVATPINAAPLPDEED